MLGILQIICLVFMNFFNLSIYCRLIYKLQYGNSRSVLINIRFIKEVKIGTKY